MGHHNGIVGSIVLSLAAAVVLALPEFALAQTDLSDCKTSMAASGKPMPAPMPMPQLKLGVPMPTGMAKETTMTTDVGHDAAMHGKCMDDVLAGEQSAMDKKK
jgi:hypothetical protein